MNKILLNVFFLLSFSALADITRGPIPNPIPRPPIPTPIPTFKMEYHPTLVRIFDKMDLSKNCSNSGLGSDSMFRGAQGVTGYDSFHDSCGARVYHEFRTALAFNDITGNLFPADIDIISATLNFKLNENGIAPGVFKLDHDQTGKTQNHCRIDLLLANSDWTKLAEGTLPSSNVFLANAPFLGYPNGQFRIDITEKFKDLYFRRAPNMGFILKGETPDIIPDNNVQCTSLIGDFIINVQYRLPQ
ncbi:MAG: hypothetical protein ACXVLQ_11925 [Bacteriovorax sp.]